MFSDRIHAGRQLAEALKPYADRNPVIVAVPRGGVVVGFEVARILEAPLDIVLVRKLGVPYQPELGFGAIGEEDVRVIDAGIVARTGVSFAAIEAVELRERAELERRAEAYRQGRLPVELTGRTAIIVDDGVATGVSTRAAAEVVRARGAATVVVAVPVGAPETVRRLASEVDDVVCIEQPASLMAIGAWYRDFHQVSDDEVTALLGRSAMVSHNGDACRAADVTLRLEVADLEGRLCVPDDATGVVVFAHGSGSSRHSPRNRRVATELNRAGLGTLLFDLLTEEEASDRRFVFDIELLSDRLVRAVQWVTAGPDTRGLPLGIFGASTGAAAALMAAVAEPDIVRAVVSRGGRPDMVPPEYLAQVRAPTMLIVGAADHPVLELNQEAGARLICEHRVEVVPGAGHLFEEPGTLEAVAHHAASWFGERLSTGLVSARR